MTAPPASLSVAVKYSDKKTDAWASVYGLAAGQHMLVLMQHLNQSPYRLGDLRRGLPDPQLLLIDIKLRQQLGKIAPTLIIAAGGDHMVRGTSQLTMEGGEIVVHRHGRIAQALMGDD